MSAFVQAGMLSFWWMWRLGEEGSSEDMREAVVSDRTQAWNVVGRRGGVEFLLEEGESDDEERESIIPARMAMPIVPGGIVSIVYVI